MARTPELIGSVESATRAISVLTIRALKRRRMTGAELVQVHYQSSGTLGRRGPRLAMKEPALAAFPIKFRAAACPGRWVCA